LAADVSLTNSRHSFLSDAPSKLCLDWLDFRAGFRLFAFLAIEGSQVFEMGPEPQFIITANVLYSEGINWPARKEPRGNFRIPQIPGLGTDRNSFVF